MCATSYGPPAVVGSLVPNAKLLPVTDTLQMSVGCTRIARNDLSAPALESLTYDPKIKHIQETRSIKLICIK